MTSGIRQWLETLGLSQYAAAFEANDIDVDVLHTLTDQDLQALGVSLGNRKRILRALKDAAPSVAAEARIPPASLTPEKPPALG